MSGFGSIGARASSKHSKAGGGCALACRQSSVRYYSIRLRPAAAAGEYSVLYRIGSEAEHGGEPCLIACC